MKYKTNEFRTKTRAALAALTLCAAAAAGCTSPDTARENANAANTKAANNGKPSVTVTQSRGPQQQQPPQQQRAAQSDTLSAEVMNAEIETLEGKTIHLSDYKDKVVVLNLWATWCGPCRKEIPHMVELNKEYASKGVELIGLTTENPQTEAPKVRDFVKTFNINYTIGWARADVALDLMRGRQTIPQTFVIVPGGRVVAHFPGYSDNLPSMLRAALDKAIAD